MEVFRCFQNSQVQFQILSKIKIGIINLITSAAKKDWSVVNYLQYLAFNYPYLSCNDHCDWWFSKSFYYYLLPATLFQPCSKGNFNRNEQFFLSFWWGNCSMMDICKSSVNQNKKCWMLSTKKVGRSGQSMFLHISRNQSNTLLLINLNGIHERDLRIT